MVFSSDKPFTVRASHGRRTGENIEDGLPDSGHCRLWWRAGDSFFPPRGGEAAGLQEGIGDHCHQGVPVQAGSGSALKMVETKLLLELLMCLFTDPSAVIAAASALIGVSFGRLEA